MDKVTIHSIPDRPSNIAVLESCTILNSLATADRQRVAEGSFMAYAERGEAIWIAGSKPEFTAVVGVGFVKMTKSTAHGQDVAAELLGPGQCFGLISGIEGRAHPLSAVAITNTWYLKVPLNLFMPIYQDSDVLKDQIVRTIAPQLRKAQDMMTRLLSGSVEERMAAVLFILADSYGHRDDQGIHLAAPLTRQDLSEMAGTTVETAIRVMSRWQKRGLVATENQVITIIDDHALLESLRM